MYDLSSRAGVLRFCESKRAEMVRCFERVGRFEENGQSFFAYLFATHEVETRGARTPHEWKTGAKMPQVKAVACRVPDTALIKLLSAVDPNRIKDIYTYVLRMQGKLQRAIGYILMTEMWYVQTPPGTKREDVKKARAEMPASLEDHPGRREGLMLSVEHQALGRQMWFAEILREPTRLLEWQDKSPDDAEGRFVDLTEWRQ